MNCIAHEWSINDLICQNNENNFVQNFDTKLQEVFVESDVKKFKLSFIEYPNDLPKCNDNYNWIGHERTVLFAESYNNHRYDKNNINIFLQKKSNHTKKIRIYLKQIHLLVI